MKISAYLLPVFFCSILVPYVALAQTATSKPIAADASLIMKEKNSALDTQELKALDDIINSVVSLKQENKSLSEKLSQSKSDFNQCVLSVNVEKARNQTALECVFQSNPSPIPVQTCQSFQRKVAHSFQ